MPCVAFFTVSNPEVPEAPGLMGNLLVPKRQSQLWRPSGLLITCILLIFIMQISWKTAGCVETKKVVYVV